MVEDDWEIVCHDMLVSCRRPDYDLIKSDPVFGVLLAVVLFKLEIVGPYD